MSRASTAKPPALAMPSRRAAVSAGFPVRRRRPDAGDCRHQGEYAGACPFWTGSLFLCLFSFFLLPKGRDLPKHGLRGDLFRIRAGRQGRGRGRKAPAGKTGFAESDAVWCGRLSHGSYRSLWSGKPHAAQGPAVQAVSCGWTGKRRPAHAWRNGYCRMGGSSRRGCRPARGCPLTERSGRKGSSIFHALMGAARRRRRGVCPG